VPRVSVGAKLAIAKHNRIIWAEPISQRSYKLREKQLLDAQIFTNICGLLKTKNRVRAPVALEADLRNQDIDVCVVSETHLSTEMPDAIVNTPDYAIFRLHRDRENLDSRKEGGVAIYESDNPKVMVFTFPDFVNLFF